MFKYVAILFLLAHLLAPAALAQDDVKPTVAFLGTGPMSPHNIAMSGLLNVLQSYGFISEAERGLLAESPDFEGERINIISSPEMSSIADIGSTIEKALDRKVDAIIAASSIVAQTAVHATSDMDDPPAVIFTRISDPYAAGIAQSACVKPDHVSGLQTVVPYEEIIPLLIAQDPDIKSIGAIHTSSDPDGIYGAARIADVAVGLGLTVESAAVVDLVDLRPAVQGLVSKGVEAIILPVDPLINAGIPIIAQAAIDNELPLYYSAPGDVVFGATIGGGSLLQYEEGAHAGLLLAAYLNGDIDLGSTGIYQAGNMFVGVNLDMAKLQGVEIAEGLLKKAIILIQDGELNVSGAAARQMALARSVGPLEERQADDAALLKSLQCTPEMIAEQQAELDAASE